MPSLNEVLSDAYDEINAAPEVAVEAPEAEPTPEPAAAAPEADAAPADDLPRDEAGRFKEKEEQKPAKGAKVAKTSTPAPAAATPTTTPQPVKGQAQATPQPAAPVATQFRAPQSWKPTEREAWGKVPPEAQAAILRREREVATALQQAAETSKGAAPWTDTIRPYEATIRQSGMEPHQYVGTMLRTIHASLFGPPDSRAQALANAVMQLGGDLIRPDRQDANGAPSSPLDRALVAILSGQGAPPPQAAQPRGPQEFRDPRLDALLKQQEERVQSEAADAIQRMSSDPKYDFFDDVADGVADILDMWGKRGKRSVTDADLDRAYNLACSMNEDVSAVIEQRKKAESVRTASVVTERTKKAASSIKSSPTAAPAAQAAGRRAALEAKYDELT